MATTAFQKWRTEWQAFRKSLLPEASDEPLKAGDWVVTPEGIGFITRVDASFTDGTTTDPLPFRVKFNKGHTLCYASGELRRARPVAEVPAPSEPTTEQLTDEQVSAELKSAGIDMQPAFERLHKMFDEHKQKQPDVDGWIEWHGGEMPVDGEQLVSRRCLDVSIPRGPCLASSLRWTHVGNRYDITHYRLVQPAPKHRPFASADEFRPHRDRWLRYKHNESGTAGRASWTTARGIEIGKHSFGWTTLFHDYVFDDNGQPCGIEVK